MTTPTTGSRVLITIFIIAGMLITGTANTLLNKWQNRVCVKNCIDGGASGGSGASRVYYEQPVVQSLTMFVGELLCLLVYYGMQAVSTWSGGARKPHGVEDEEKAPLLAGASGTGQTDAGSASTSTIARRGGAADAIADEQCSIESLVDMDDDDDTAIDDKTRLLREKNGGMGRDTPTIDVVDADKQPVPMQGWAHLYLWLPALCDIIGSTLMNVGLLVVFASVYQMV